MAATSKIESDDLTLGEVYKDFYVVPDFQREFVWGTDEVDRLLLDIYDSLYDADGRPIIDTEYFIGSVVCCTNAQGAYQLIDGQQRVTTLYVLLCAIRDAIRDAGGEPEEPLKQHIRNARQDPQTGRAIPEYRVLLQYEDSAGVLEEIASDEPGDEGSEAKTLSVTNIRNAYRCARQFLSATFGDDVDALTAFHGALTFRVKLIRIKTPDLADALKVFETINDRGVGLDAMDLLKNLLFINTPSGQYARLKQRWKTITDTLYGSKEKPLRFLRYYIMANHEIDARRGIREDDIYKWFRANASQCGIDSAPLEFVDTLVECSAVWANFVAGRDTDGNANVYLQNIAALSGVARQHFVLLLAGRHLPEVLFSSLAGHIEDLLFTYVICREATKEFERNFTRWAPRLRAIATEADLDSFIADHFAPEMGRLSPAFDFAFQELGLDRIQQYRMRYILAKMTQHVERQAWGNPKHDRIDQYLDRSVQIEHILPQNPRGDVREAFDRQEEYEEWMQRFGNLTLLERPINAAVSNGSFEEKAPGYEQSRFLLTQSIVTRPEVGRDTSVNRAVRDLLQFDHWHSESIAQRQAMLGQLARVVWGMPVANVGSGHE